MGGRAWGGGRSVNSSLSNDGSGQAESGETTESETAKQVMLAVGRRGVRRLMLVLSGFLLLWF